MLLIIATHAVNLSVRAFRERARRNIPPKAALMISSKTVLINSSITVIVANTSGLENRFADF